MISFSNPGGAIFLANLNITENANQKTQEQISSGRRVSVAEDAPDQIGVLLGLEAQQAGNTQIQTNLTNTQTLANGADQALTSTLQLVDQISSAGTEGISASATPITRQTLAQQVQSYLSQIVSLSQTAIGGRYVFGGDADQTASYQIDSASPNGVDRLIVTGASSTIQDPNGAVFLKGLTAEQIFDHRNSDDSFASDNLFASVQSLYTALNNNDTTGITNALGSISVAAKYVNSQQGFYGALENRLTQALSSASNIGLNLTQQISAIRDTDFSQAAIDLTQGQTQLQASLTARSKIPQTSLFNYLG